MGRPKAELRIGRQPILEYLLERLAWPGPTLLVTAPGREHPPAWKRFTREVADPVAGEGPLRGVLTALEHSATLLVAVTTVDMPNVGRTHLEWLIAQLGETQNAVAVMSRRGDQVEPFPAVYSTAAAGPIGARLSAGDLSVQALAQHPDFATVPAPGTWDETELWTNLNRPEDLDAFLTRRSFRADR